LGIPFGIAVYLTGPLPIGLRRALNESNQVFEAAFFHLLEETFDDVFPEVFGLPVRGLGRLIAILFVEHNGVGIVLEMVGDEVDTSRFEPGCDGQQAHCFCYFRTIFRVERKTDN
jgi:hypothetical protein